MSGEDRSPGTDPVAADGPGSEPVAGAEYPSPMIEPDQAGPLLPGSAPINQLVSHLLSAPGQFTIDFDRAPQAIADLEHAAEFMIARAERARQLGEIPAPGADEVSTQVVREIGKWATEGPSSLVAGLESGASELRAMAEGLRADIATHVRTEQLDIPTAMGGLEL